MSKGINAKAWFYSQSFHSTRDFQPSDEELAAAQERARARWEPVREALKKLEEQ